MIRPATDADLTTLATLYGELERDVGGPEYLQQSWEQQRDRVTRVLGEGGVLVAEEDGELVGFAEFELDGTQLVWVEALHVRDTVRRKGLRRALLRAVGAAAREQGAEHLGLSVALWNDRARSLYDRLGFTQIGLELAVDLGTLDTRLERTQGPTFGSVHVQTDDEAAVRRAVETFVPRLGASEGTVVTAPRQGWVAVYDELCDREPAALRRLARELSDRMGAVVLMLGVEGGAVARYVLFDNGRIADEYASVPEHHGPLPPGDVVALAANPTVAKRLTGADPERLRAAARTAASAADLPPAQDILVAVAAALGVEGGDRGYNDAE